MGAYFSVLHCMQECYRFNILWSAALVPPLEKWIFSDYTLSDKWNFFRSNIYNHIESNSMDRFFFWQTNRMNEKRAFTTRKKAKRECNKMSYYRESLCFHFIYTWVSGGNGQPNNRILDWPGYIQGYFVEFLRFFCCSWFSRFCYLVIAVITNRVYLCIRGLMHRVCKNVDCFGIAYGLYVVAIQRKWLRWKPKDQKERGRENAKDWVAHQHTRTLDETNVFGHTLSLLHFVVIAGFRYETTIISISSESDVGWAAF